MVSRGSPQAIVATDPVTMYSTPLLLSGSMNRRNQGNSATKEIPPKSLHDLLLTEIWLAMSQIDHKPVPTEIQTVARNLQPLDRRHAFPTLHPQRMRNL